MGKYINQCLIHLQTALIIADKLININKHEQTNKKF